MDTLHATHSGAIIQDSENVSIENAVGGDLYQIENYTEQGGGFAEINTGAYAEPLYTPPSFTSSLLAQIEERKMVIISGGAGFDKNELARHLAHCIASGATDMEVREWRDADSSSMLDEIRETRERTFFVIPDAAPQYIAHDVTKFASLVRQHGHYAVLTTELPDSTWQQPEAVFRLYRYEVPASGLYSAVSLQKHFILKAGYCKDVFGIARDEELVPATVLAKGITAASLSANFESPGQISFFLMLLEADRSDHPLDIKIREALFTIKDKSETLVTKWYRSLNPTERLIALGASLMDGLLDDQFFAVMQQVVDDFWHYRDSSLQSLDYCDLDFLLNFFAFESFGDGRQILVCKYPNQRADIIRVAWHSNKRHILSAFTVLTSLAGSSSGSGRRYNAEINGTRARGMRLRSVVAETISDIGIVSLQAAEPKLMDLAASSDLTIRRITAKAMARWRAFGKDDQMYTTLARWQSSRSVNVRSAVVFTLQYAAEFDSPGHLDSRIMMLLNEMSGDRAVLASMNEILERITANHLFVVQDDLRDYFAVEAVYADVLTKGILPFYSTHPEQLKVLLENWLSSCWGESSRNNRRAALTYRDNKLVLVLKIYRMLPYGTGNDVIELGYVWSLLDRLHDHEQRAGMRAFILETAAHLIVTHPEAAIQHIEPIFRKLGTEGRLAMIRSIGQVYLSQRSSLPGAQYTISLQGWEIPVWPGSIRPITEIESVLYRWLTGPNSFAREVATLAFVEFAVLLDRDEPALAITAVNAAAEREQENARARFEQEQQQRMEARVVYPVMPELSLWTRIKIFFWLLFRTREEEIVFRELMRTLLMYKKTNPSYLGVVIRRWGSHGDAKVRHMAWWIGKLVSF